MFWLLKIFSRKRSYERLPVPVRVHDLCSGSAQSRFSCSYTETVSLQPALKPHLFTERSRKSLPSRHTLKMSPALAYAVSLQGMSVEGLERGPLRQKLLTAGFGTILDAVLAQDQEGAIGTDSFAASLQDHLDQGNFRLVLVLDEVSAELERIVAYLDRITVHALTVDLISLNVYEVNGAQVALPQCVTPNLSESSPLAPPERAKFTRTGEGLTDGADVFRDSFADTAGESRETFEMLSQF